MGRPLTQKQEKFILNIFEGMTQRDAWIAAGYSHNYSVAVIDSNACQLFNTNKIQIRYKELKQKAEDASIATVLERKQILTEIMRGRFADFMTKLTPEKLKSAALQEIKITEVGIDNPVKTTTIKLHNPIQAISELNKMERIYEVDGGLTIDNRTLNIYVNSDKAKKLTERLIAGERTGGDNGHKDL